MSDVLVLLSLLITTMTGFCTLRLIQNLNNRSFLEDLSLAFGLGVGFNALELAVYSLFSIPWKPAFLLAPQLIIIFAGLLGKTKEVQFHVSKLPFTRIQTFLLCLIAVLLLFVGFEAQLRPLYAWDGYAIWLFKAKVFFLDGKIDSSHTYYLQNSYPYTLPLAIAYIYAFIGYIDDRSILLFFFLFYAATSGLLFYSLRDSVGVTKALLATVLFMSIQNVMRHGGRWEAGYADLALGYYFFSCIILLKTYLKRKNVRTFFFLSLFIAITSIVKDESIPFVTAVGLFLFISTLVSKKYIHTIFLIGSYIPLIVWTMYKNTHRFFPNYLFDRTSLHPQRIFEIFWYIAKEVVNIERWNFLWIFFILSFVLFLAKHKKNFPLFVFAIIFFQLATYMLIFIISPYPPSVHIPSVMDRLFLHLTPPAVYISAISVLGKSHSN